MNEYMKVNLSVFDDPYGHTNVTTDHFEDGQSYPTYNDLSAEMRTFYDKLLLKNALPNLVHNMFGQKRPIPKNGGKTIQFRRYSSLPKALDALTEGVTPDGSRLDVTEVTATVQQYGDFIALSDFLIFTAIDNNLAEATELLGAQAGLTLDTITKNVLLAGTQVIHAGGKSLRANMVGGSATATENDYISVKEIRRAVRELEVMNAKRIDGWYRGIIHPDIKYDLMSDPEWKAPHQYQDTSNVYANEIGEIAGVRFVESSEAGVVKNVAIDKSGGSSESSARDVYATLIFGKNAYGVTEVEGLGLQHIVKQLGSGDDPLNQRATAGWKASHAAVILDQTAMIRIESTSSFDNALANDSVLPAES